METNRFPVERVCSRFVLVLDSRYTGSWHLCTHLKAKHDGSPAVTRIWPLREFAFVFLWLRWDWAFRGALSVRCQNGLPVDSSLTNGQRLLSGSLRVSRFLGFSFSAPLVMDDSFLSRLQFTSSSQGQILFESTFFFSNLWTPPHGCSYLWL